MCQNHELAPLPMGRGWVRVRSIATRSSANPLSSETPASSVEPAGVFLFTKSSASVTQQKHIPSPAADVLMLCVVNFGAITKLIAELIGPLRQFVIERD